MTIEWPFNGLGVVNAGGYLALYLVSDCIDYCHIFCGSSFLESKRTAKRFPVYKSYLLALLHLGHRQLLTSG